MDALEISAVELAEPTILANYTKQITAAAKAGARVVLLPEKIIDVDATALPTLQAELQAIATNHKVQLIAGLAVSRGQRQRLQPRPGSASRRQCADVVRQASSDPGARAL